MFFWCLQINHRILAAQLTGLFIEVESAKFSHHLSVILPIIQQQIDPGRYSDNVCCIKIECFTILSELKCRCMSTNLEYCLHNYFDLMFSFPIYICKTFSIFALYYNLLDFLCILCLQIYIEFQKNVGTLFNLCLNKQLRKSLSQKIYLVWPANLQNSLPFKLYKILYNNLLP